MGKNIANNRRRKVKSARLRFVALGLKEGMSYQDIADMVGRELDIKPPSKSTVYQDTQTLLQEWRETNIRNMEDMVTLELARIDSTISELWEAWRKSKEDQELMSEKKKGVLLPNGRKIISKDGDLVDEKKIKTIAAERTEKTEIGYGDVRYITEIRHQLIERRKLLGLYTPEKQEMNITEPSIDVSVLSIEQLKVLTEINRAQNTEPKWLELKSSGTSNA